MIRMFLAATLSWVFLLAAPVEAFTIKQVKSPGGISAWLVEDHTVPLISMNFSFKGGAAQDPDDRQGVANFLTTMLDEGAGDMPSREFQTREQELAMRLSFNADQDHFRGSFQTLSKNRDEAFSLLALALNQPRFDTDPLERMRAQLLQGLEQSAQDPETITSLAFMKQALGDHPYAGSSDGTLEGVKAVTADDLRSLRTRLFARDSLLISAVGDIDEKTLGALLDKTFGALPEKSAMGAVAEITPPQAASLIVVDRDIPQSIIQFGLPGIKRDDPDFIPAFVMNFILGGGGFGSRLMEEVREKRGLSYSVWTDLYPLEAGGLIIGGAATRNEKAAETIAIIRAEIAQLATEGPTEAELADVKTFLTGSYALRFNS
ncbi:MAG: insulinase family protein, partial [Aestuariivirgaceae bacterium]|nr:insulinase family protein [Aestuariivirgaceae bacterium]